MITAVDTNILLDILVPYFHAGIVANEYCLWVVAPYEFVSAAEARAVFGKAWAEFNGNELSEKIDIVRWNESSQILIANALKQHHIGLEEINDGIWSIYFNRVLLARLDERDCVIRD